MQQVAMGIEVFQSEDRLRETYLNGLQGILEEPRLPRFIVALANNTHEPLFREALWPATESALAKIISQCADDLAQPPTANESEDLIILRRVVKDGIDSLGLTEYSQIDDWCLQFNRVRSFRPYRIGKVENSVYAPFNEKGFHFDKPFLAPERIWQGKLCGKDASLFFNKFPFAKKLHGVLVPEQEKHHIQFMFPYMHAWLWEVTEYIGQFIEGFGIGFNSLSALASVNMFHGQTFADGQNLPIAKPCWQHNGGEKPYPLPVNVFTSVNDSWEWIRRSISHNEPHNLIYRPGKIYAWNRRHQNQVHHDLWTSGFAWFEGGGNFIASKKSQYLQLQQEPHLIGVELDKIVLN